MNYSVIYNEAAAAANAAERSCTPTPMVVGTPSTPWGNSIDHSKPTYYVADGPCGYAWVRMKGNTPFARWCKQQRITRPAYPTGVSIYPSTTTQSLERKEAWCNAFVEVLKKHGIDAYVDSRLD